MLLCLPNNWFVCFRMCVLLQCLHDKPYIADMQKMSLVSSSAVILFWSLGGVIWFHISLFRVVRISLKKNRFESSTRRWAWSMHTLNICIHKKLLLVIWTHQYRHQIFTKWKKCNTYTRYVFQRKKAITLMRSLTSPARSAAGQGMLNLLCPGSPSSEQCRSGRGRSSACWALHSHCLSLRLTKQ